MQDREKFKFLAKILMATMILGGLLGCMPNTPRQMRATQDSLTDDSRSPLEGAAYQTAVAALTATSNAVASAAASSDSTCPNSTAMFDSKIFNTYVTICRPNSNEPTKFKIKLASAPSGKFCFFPVHDASNLAESPVLVSLGKPVCLGFSSDNTYQDLVLPRNRISWTGRYNYASANFQMAGIIAMPQSSAYFVYPCPKRQSSKICSPSEFGEYSVNVSSENAYHIAQDYFEVTNFDAHIGRVNNTIGGYYFLQQFYNQGKYLYIQFQ